MQIASEVSMRSGQIESSSGELRMCVARQRFKLSMSMP